MQKASGKSLSADEIADLADAGGDVTPYFTNQFTVVRPAIQRVNVDFTAHMLRELDHEAESLNISRQALIKTMLREALDRRHQAQLARHA